MAGGYVHIERDVEIEVVDPAELGNGNVFGTASTSRLPEFTEEELRYGLGDEFCDMVENLFARLVEDRDSTK